MRNYFLFWVLLITTSFSAQLNKPNAVIAVVVDQMKYEYIYRFWNEYGQDGFKKLHEKGVFCRNTHYNYIPTYTGPGHASIFTGTTPSVHGIIGNSWYTRDSLKPVYCAGDWKAQTLCLCQQPHDNVNRGDGNMSPRNLLSTTIGDQLKTVDSLSKVFGVSLKDRGAILSAGISADGAFWMNSKGDWITSTFYNSKFPMWIKEFSDVNSVESYMNGIWEGSSFSLNLQEMYQKMGPSAIKSTPKGNQILWDFSKELIHQEGIGKDTHTDLLIVSFSATDYVGHQYGPDAEQTKSMYIKLDEILAQMLSYFDQSIGKGKYTLMLTADHGAGTSPDVLKKRKLNGGHFSSRELLAEVNQYLLKTLGSSSLISREINMQYYLNFSTMDSLRISYDQVYTQVKYFLEKKEFIHSVYNKENVAKGLLSNEKSMLIKGIHPKRSGDMFLVLSPGYLEWSKTTGTAHATHYNYDTHVPLFFYGKGVNKNKCIDKRIQITDIAPTLSLLMKTSFPSGCTGNPIKGVMCEN